ncbi:MAG: DNA polymerase III subunit gamma/tau [Candidatus Omnitrophica bacterium]|nr:DNA polymerase III subunit gamma/tau [Candidatus Omnitrophota bacterium]
MMSYLPLARKYRPQTFEELVGQSHVTTTLTRAIASKRIAQAYLFAGQRGVGKTSAARILAKSLNCAKGPTATPCQKCTSCQQITIGVSLDVVEIDGASNRGIDEIRALRETVKFAPSHGAFRIYIIDEVHQITHDAFNALLKTLEEPPAHVKFIFATTVPQKVPPTILSRCQRFDFRRVETKTIVEVLQRLVKAEKVVVDEAALYAIARASEGSLRDAEVTLEQAMSFCEKRIREADVTQLLGGVEQDVLMQWAQAILERDAPTALSLLAQQIERGKDVIRLLTDLLLHLRHRLIIVTTAQASERSRLRAELIDLPVDAIARLEEQSQQTNAQELLMMMQVVTGAYDLVRRSPLSQAIVELVVIQLATRDSWMSLDHTLKQLERLAATTTPSNPPSPREPSGIARPAMERLMTPVPPQPSTPPVTSVHPNVAFERVVETWPTLLERLGQQKMSLASYLMDTRPLGIEGEAIQIGVPAIALHQEVLGATEHVRLIEQLLGELLGQSVKIAYTTLPEPPPSPPTAHAEAAVGSSPTVSHAAPSVATPAPMPPIVQDIVSLFDATLIKSPSSRPATS